MTRPDLPRLQRLAELAFDKSRAALTEAAQKAQTSRDALARLDLAPTRDRDDLALLQQEMVYDRWAESRRAEINLIYAGQRAELLLATEAARREFGRLQAISRLVDRTASRRGGGI
jgi:hypothetical protein